jgi:hypothetical protein
MESTTTGKDSHILNRLSLAGWHSAPGRPYPIHTQLVILGFQAPSFHVGT